jgi:PIN domain nuclease of toxin-antitoxin system
VPIDKRIAVRAVHLADFPHSDPVDRMIVATALGMGATLLTADARLQAYPLVKTIWD